MSDDLRQTQYRDSAKLNARIALHMKYGRGGGLGDFTDRLALGAGARVLEVGCGPGRMWERLVEKAPPGLDLTLTDYSPGMVEEALARVSGLGRWRVRGQVADVCALPFGDAAFDVVLAMHMLYHAGDPEAAVGEIARVLGPDGAMVASTNGLDNLAALFALGAAAFGHVHVDPAAPFSLDNGQAMLGRRFAEVEVARARDEMRITDPADVVAYLTSFPPGDTASPAMLARLETEVARAFDAGGGVFAVVRDTGYIIGRGPRRR